MRQRFLGAMLALVAAFFAMPANLWANEYTYRYQMDDVYGSSGIGAQWVISTLSNLPQSYAGTRGAAMDVDDQTVSNAWIETGANFIRSRDHVYSLNGNAKDFYLSPRDPIDFIFMVIPGSDVEASVRFSLLSSDLVPGSATTLDVRMGEHFYVTEKESGWYNDLTNWYKLHLTKTTNATQYDTQRTYMIFHQNPDNYPSQTLNIPLVIANVYNGTAEYHPLTFRMALRDNSNSTTLGGNIVTYNHFKWDAVTDTTVGGANDWIFVPLEDWNVNANAINYRLTADIRNFCGIRYGLQRYDTGSQPSDIEPIGWKMDLPSNVADAGPALLLDSQSHIPPGLITTYRQNYNIVTGLKKLFRLYPIDSTGAVGSPHDLTLAHPTIRGVKLADVESGSFYDVTGFHLRPYQTDTEFLKNAASVMKTGSAAMPREDDAVMGSAVQPSSVGGEEISTIAISADIPSRMMISEDVTGLLPLHITFKLPKSDQYIAPKWSMLLDEWKSSGDIRNLFAKSFSLFTYDTSGRKINLFTRLQNQGRYNQLVKVFMDEEYENITVSLIVMLADSEAHELQYIHDKSTTSEAYFLVIRDGNRNDAWDLKMYIAPYDSDNDNNDDDDKRGSGGGGGCDAGVGAMLAIFCGVGALCWKKGRRV